MIQHCLLKGFQICGWYTVLHHMTDWNLIISTYKLQCQSPDEYLFGPDQTILHLISKHIHTVILITFNYLYILTTQPQLNGIAVVTTTRCCGCRLSHLFHVSMIYRHKYLYMFVYLQTFHGQTVAQNGQFQQCDETECRVSIK